VLDAIERMKEELINAFREEISGLKDEVKGLLLLFRGIKNFE
jgi:hypothetical protein